jgi:hypothetical protein
MSIAHILKDGIIHTGELYSGKIRCQHTVHEHTDANLSVKSYVDNAGYFHVEAGNGTRLLSFNNSHTLVDSILQNHIATTNNTQQESVSALQAIIDQQQTEINNLKTYVDNLKQFLATFKEAIFIEGQAGSGFEFNYQNLI